MTKFFNKFKKPCFWPIFGPFSQFWGQKLFFKKIGLCHAQLHMGILAPYQNLEKTNETIPRKHPDRQKDGQKDEQTLFYRILLATIRGPKSDFYELWQEHKRLKTMEMSGA